MVDGDTLVIENNQLIRLLNTNAPDPDLCGGAEAKQFLENLVLEKDVRLYSGPNDSFGRQLALVYLLDDTLANERLISAGWARFTSAASPESERLKAAFSKAKENKVGIFAACLQSQNPANTKCNIKGNIREGRKTYFYPGCGNYSNVLLELDQGDQWFCNEAEAQQAGFTKAVNCH